MVVAKTHPCNASKAGLERAFERLPLPGQKEADKLLKTHAIGLPSGGWRRRLRGSLGLLFLQREDLCVGHRVLRGGGRRILLLIDQVFLHGGQRVGLERGVRQDRRELSNFAGPVRGQSQNKC